MLRSKLAKSEKEQGANVTLKQLADVEKLKKHITIVCDRLAKGAIL